MPSALPLAHIAAAVPMFFGGLEHSDRNEEHGNRRLPTPLFRAHICAGYFGACGAAGLPVVEGTFALRDDCILRGPEPVTGA